MEASSLHLLYEAHTLIARAEAATNSTTSTQPSRPPIYKAIGLSLAVASGLLIGSSFVLKKTGLLKANEKYNEEAGEGYGYLKNAYWWAGMSLMILGEVCNFVAYAFVDAILVTPLGALSVVVTTILSAIFLKERLSFVGKIGCFNCILGSVVIVMNAPEQSAVANIQEMKDFVIHPGFLSYAGVIIVACAFIALWAGPRYGKKSMLVYLSICSLIGGLSVVATQGLGSAVVAQAGGKPQFNQWFLYVLLVFVVTTLLTEIIYLNKALNLFNAALVTPTYYVLFTTSTIVTSAVLFRGFHGTPVGIATVIMGFLQICAGVVLLQLSKSAKDVPDAAVFKGDLDQVREVAEQEQPETEPKADAIRGTAALIRRISTSRAKMELAEFRRLHNEKLMDHLEPVKENEIVEWDGLRRRKTIIGPSNAPGSPIVRRKTIHPPLGMSHFPEAEDTEDRDRAQTTPGILENIRYRASSLFHPLSPSQHPVDRDQPQSPMHPVALTDIQVHPSKSDSPAMPYSLGGFQEDHVYGLPPALRKPKLGSEVVPSPRSKPLPNEPIPSPIPMLSPSGARRQFSFTNFLGRNQRPATPVGGHDDLPLPPSRSGLGSRNGSYSREQKQALKNASEEERLGLVKGDSHRALLDSSPERSNPLPPIPGHSHSESMSSDSDIEDGGEKYYEQYEHASHSGPHSYSRGRQDVYYYSHPRDNAHSDNEDDRQMTRTRKLTDPTQRPVAVSATSSGQPVSEQPRPSSRKRPSPPRPYQAQATPQYTIYSNPNTAIHTLPAVTPSQGQGSHSRTTSATRHQGQGQVGQTVRPILTESGRSQPSSTNPIHIRMVSQDRGRERDRDRQTTQQSNPAFGSNVRREQSPEDMDESETGNSKKRFEAQSARERDERRKRMSGGWPNPGSGAGAQGGFI